MNVLSLFDGMSCGQIALERAGIKVDNYFASEVDKHAIQVTMHNYPNTIQLGDVRNIDLSKLPKIDLLIGGSPCQSFSFAGKREGMATECSEEITTLEQYLKLKQEGFEFKGQSYLFWEYVYILKKLKPKYFLLENVRMAKKWQAVIDKALGVNGININSALVSAQNRPRIYWTNIPNVEQPEDKRIALKDILEADKDVDIKFALSASKIDRVLTAKRGRGFFYSRQHEKIGTLIKLYRKNPTDGCYIESPFPRKLTLVECERLQTVPEGYTNIVSNSQRYHLLGNGWTVDVIVHILGNIKQPQIEFFKPTLF
jgi:DNA-cytosine methyltransferase